MISKLKADQDVGPSSGQPDALVDLLLSARPDVAPLDAAATNRILSNVLQETSLAAPIRRTDLAGARFVLSAAFCICAAAGMLLLRSVASERSTRQQLASQHVSTRAILSTDPLFVHRYRPKAVANQFHIITSMPVNRASIARDSTTNPGERPTRYELPPTAVCGMTTFAIFTPMPSESGDTPYETGDQEGESLLVCIVSNVDQYDTDGTWHRSNGVAEKTPGLTEDQLPSLILALNDIVCQANWFAKSAGSNNSSPPILVGAALSACISDSQESENASFALQSAGTGLVLSLPDYNTI